MAKKKKNLKVREPIKIRFKDLSDGQQSIYFDYYVNGKRSYEFLRKYIKPTDTQTEIDNLLTEVEKIRQNRLTELNAPDGYVPTYKKKITLFAFIEEWKQTKASHKDNSTNKLQYHLKKFTKDIQLSAINLKFINDFTKYLQGCTKQNTSSTYLAKLKQILNEAAKNNLISYRLPDEIKSKREESHKNFLTIEELNTLASTPAPDNIKTPFLFCCLTGLRYSDISNLKWRNIINDNGNFSIYYTQQKTGKKELLPISIQAAELLGNFKKDDEFIFSELPSNATANYHLKKWVKLAGITKNIHWHCSRHTFATLTLNSGAGIHTVQKLLGHSTAKQTETYAKLLDPAKRAAIDNLPTINL